MSVYSDYQYWWSQASQMARRDARYTSWKRVFELDYELGRLSACLMCAELYPMPETITEGRKNHRSWVHAREWLGPEGKGFQGTTSLDVFACLAAG